MSSCLNPTPLAGSIPHDGPFATATWPRETLLRLLLVAGSLVVGLAAGEVALRAVHYLPAQDLHASRIHDDGWTTVLDCYPSNPRGYFDINLSAPASRERYLGLQPHRYDKVARRTPFAIESRYNALHFREHPPTPKTPGVTRVAIVGDSFTEGQGVREADTSARRLEERLRASGHGGWEVVNCGRRGADFPELNDVFTAALQYEPDIVVYAMVLNDADRSAALQARQERLSNWILDYAGASQDSLGWLDSRLFAFTREKWATLRVTRASVAWYREIYGAPNGPGWARTREWIQEMDRQMRRRDGRFAVALWPLLADLEAGYPFTSTHETIRRFCETAGISFCDLRASLAGHRTAELWVHAVDHHPNERAHALAADALLPVVLDLERARGRVAAGRSY